MSDLVAGGLQHQLKWVTCPQEGEMGIQPRDRQMELFAVVTLVIEVLGSDLTVVHAADPFSCSSTPV